MDNKGYMYSKNIKDRLLCSMLKEIIWENGSASSQAITYEELK